MNTPEAAIARQRERWISAINGGSAEDFLEVVADDAVWLPARSDAIVGKPQIRAWLSAPFQTYDFDYSVSQVRLRVAGEWAIEQARFTTVVTTEDNGDLPPHRGSYIVLWRRYADDQWLIERYVDLSAHFEHMT
ncbi:MAG: SgcJ/EcaC family oxidoreductase [Rhodothermia bacterium]|nr:SgcJ/EcaC family oxidoreductase [Rhodothermia bacterium]